jgi:hypothetical protein
MPVSPGISGVEQRIPPSFPAIAKSLQRDLLTIRRTDLELVKSKLDHQFAETRTLQE